jgi:tetratricopeptide (TPR) repeat protein
LLAQSDAAKEEGNTFFKQGQYGDAERCYAKAIGPLPPGHSNLVPLLNNRAAARLKTGDYKGVISDCQEVEAMCRRDFDYDINSEQLREAKDALSKALLRRGTAYEASEKYDEALVDFRGALEYNSNAKGVHDGIRRCLKAQQDKLKPPVDPPAPKAVASVQPKQSPTDIFDSMAMASPSSGTSALNDLASLGQQSATPKSSTAVPSPTGDFHSQNLDNLREREREKEALDDAKFAAKDKVDARLVQWRGGKEANIRALLSSLDLVLWDGIRKDLKSVGLSELVTPNQVKIKYMKVIARLHPDKLSSMQLTGEQMLLANGIFGALNDAWDAFKQQNNLK